MLRSVRALAVRRRGAAFAAAVLVALVALSAPACTSDDTTVSATGTASTPPPWRSWIVTPRTPGTAPAVLDAPAGDPLVPIEGGEAVALSDPLPSGAPLALLAKRLDVEAAGTRWHEVFLPVRPNGATGWVADRDVTVTHTDLAVRIRLADRRLEVLDEGRPVGSFEIAVGEDVTPTPTGTFFLKELLAPADPAGSYGPLAYGLSGFSPAILDAQEFADGVIGLHGTDRPELIGQAVSHGCIRMRNADIEKVRDYELPLGTPVVIES